jgi:hypothetical protein
MIMLAANFSWRGLPGDVIVPVGEQPKKEALEWLLQFSAINKRVLLYQIKGEWFAFGPPAFRTEISERVQRGENLFAE